MILRKSLIASTLLLALILPSFLHAGEVLRGNFATDLSFEIIPKAHAAPPASGTVESTAQKFFAGVLDVLVVVNWIGLSAAQTLLHPDVILGKLNPQTNVRPMEELLHGIWVLSRNIVNAIFAFILLAGGIMLVIGAGGEGMSKIKQAAPKFVMAVILVNFSWFFPRVILDTANVLTSVVYQIPSLVGKMECIREIDPGPDEDIETTEDNEEIPCDFVWKVVLFPESPEDCVEDSRPPEECTRPEKSGDFPNRGVQIGGLIDIYYDSWKDLANTGSYKNAKGQDVAVSGGDLVLNGLAVNFAKLPNFAIINFQNALGSPGTLTGLEQAQAYLRFLVEVVLQVILSGAVGLALIALAVVLIVRMGVLWLCIAFMQFIFIGFAMGKPLGDLGKEGAPNIWQKFLSYAFLPTLVAVPFSVGFTLISRLYSIPSMPIHTNIENLTFIKEIGSLHELIWMIIAIGIIWFGVFAVLEKDDFAKGIVGGIKGIGTTAAKAAGAGLGYGVQVPLPGGRSVSIGSVLEGLQNSPRFIRDRGLAQTNSGKIPPAPSAGEVQSKVNVADQSKLTAALNKAGSAGGTIEALRSDLSKIMDEKGKNRAFSDLDIDGMTKNRAGLQRLLNSKDKGDKPFVDETKKNEILRKFDESESAKGGGASSGGGGGGTPRKVNFGGRVEIDVKELGSPETSVNDDKVISKLFNDIRYTERDSGVDGASIMQGLKNTIAESPAMPLPRKVRLERMSNSEEGLKQGIFDHLKSLEEEVRKSGKTEVATRINTLKVGDGSVAQLLDLLRETKTPSV